MATRRPRTGPVSTEKFPESLGRQARLAARLAEELTLVAAQHAADLSEVATLGAFVLVVGGIAGTIVREGRADFEVLMDFLGRQLRDAASNEFRGRSLIH
jgi:hypothetical protein